MKLSLEPVRARLRAPFAAAWGTINDREILVVRLEADDGTVGWGEAAPLPGYGCTAVEQTWAVIKKYRGALARAGDGSRDQILAACAEASNLPEALAAVDLALWDLEGRRTGQPVWQMLVAQGSRDITRSISGQ